MRSAQRGGLPRSAAYLPAARRCQRVAFSIFLCFFFRMRLRRFLMSDPMAADQGISFYAPGRRGEALEERSPASDGAKRPTAAS